MVNLYKIALFLPLLSVIPIHGIKLTNLAQIMPNLVIQMPYKTENNFTKKCIYPDNAQAYLLPEVATALAKVQKKLNQKGLGLLIWDAYRPNKDQEAFWEVFPDDRYVANPYKRGSVHSRGAAVDITLIHLNNGQQLDMPTKFDDFSEMAWANTIDGLSKEQIENREILTTAMASEGFRVCKTEWWHYDWIPARENSQNYPILSVTFDELEQNKD